MDTPGKIKRAAKALQYATDNAGRLAVELTIETGGDVDIEDHNASVREEACGEWQEQTGAMVGSVRAQVAEVEQHIRDITTRATIANFLFDASLYAGDAERS